MKKKSKRRQKPKLFIIFAALKHSEPLQRETNSDFRFSQTSLIHHLKIIAFVKFPTPASQLQPYVFQRIKLKYLNNSLYCMYNIIQLNDKNLSELQAIAQELGIKNRLT